MASAAGLTGRGAAYCRPLPLGCHRHGRSHQPTRCWYACCAHPRAPQTAAAAQAACLLSAAEDCPAQPLQRGRRCCWRARSASRSACTPFSNTTSPPPGSMTAALMARKVHTHSTACSLSSRNGSEGMLVIADRVSPHCRDRRWLEPERSAGQARL